MPPVAMWRTIRDPSTMTDQKKTESGEEITTRKKRTCRGGRRAQSKKIKAVIDDI